MLPSILAMLLNHPMYQPTLMGRPPKTRRQMLQRQRLLKLSPKSWVLHNAPSSSRKLLKERICLMLLPTQTSPPQLVALWHLPPNPMLPNLFWKVRWVLMKPILTRQHISLIQSVTTTCSAHCLLFPLQRCCMLSPKHKGRAIAGTIAALATSLPSRHQRR